jgi:hypothetical protein
LLLLALAPQPALAEPAALAAEPSDRPIPPYAQVVDESGLLDTDSVAALQRIIGATEAEVGVRVAVLVVSTVEGQDPARLAKRVYEAWPLARRGRDDGLLLLYAAREHWWQLWWGSALDARLAEPALLAPARQVLVDPAERPVGQRLVAATALLARAAGASAEAVAEPYQGRRDWGRLWIGAGALLLFLVVALGTWAHFRGMTALEAWHQRRLAAGRAGALRLTEEAGGRFSLRSRQSIVVLLVPLFLGSWNLPRIGLALAERWSRGVEAFRCSQEEGACVVEWEAGAYRIPLSSIDRFEKYHHGTGKGLLLAVTRHGNTPLAEGWPEEALEGLHLNELLTTPDAPPVERRHDFAPHRTAERAAAAALALLFAALLWYGFWPWRLTVDLEARWISLRRPLRSWERSLDGVRGVRLWTPQQAMVEQAARTRSVLSYTRPPDVWVQVALVDAEGRRLPVTGLLAMTTGFGLGGPRRDRIAGGRAVVEAAAQRMAAHLGLPLLPPVDAPSGAVPPPLAEAPAPVTPGP